MPNKNIIYIGSCGFIDVMKSEVGLLPVDRNDDVWHIKQLLRARRAGDVEVITSYLTLAECVAVESGQSSVPEEVQEHFRRLLNSRQYVAHVQQTPRTGELAQRLRWQHGLVLGGPDGLHLAAAIEMSAVEFISTDDRLQKPKLAAAPGILGNMGIRLIRGSATLCLPEKYLQGSMRFEQIKPK